VSVVLAGYSVPFYFPWEFVLLSVPVVNGGVARGRLVARAERRVHAGDRGDRL